jgi:acyl carrier protein
MNMNESEIKEAIFRQIRRIAPDTNPAAVGPDEDLRDALSIDSFDFLNILIGLDKELGVDVPEVDYGRLSTLRQMIAYLSERLKAGATSVTA